MTAQLRKWFYLLSAAASSLIPILVASHAITSERGASWTALIAALGGVLGALGGGTAAVVVHKQQASGAFDPTPSPADQMINGAQAAKDQLNAAQSELERAKQGVSDILGQAPIIGPLAQQVIDIIP